MKTAAELFISEAEHNALQAVAAGLASGQYTEENEKIFDMNIECSEGKCGTVACIGGWVGLEMGMSIKDAERYVSSNCTLDVLYFPSCNWSAITPAIAAEGIYNFLETGNPDFERLVASCS